MARKASSKPDSGSSSTATIGLGSFINPNSSFRVSPVRRLAIMNLASRGIEAGFGPEHADIFRRDLRRDMNRESVDRTQTHSRNRFGNLTNLKSN